MQRKLPRPTLVQLYRGAPWWWLDLWALLHGAPMALVPFMNRWGPDTSSDRLRRSARCEECGAKGATSEASELVRRADKV